MEEQRIKKRSGGLKFLCFYCLILFSISCSCLSKEERYMNLLKFYHTDFYLSNLTLSLYLCVHTYSICCRAITCQALVLFFLL